MPEPQDVTNLMDGYSVRFRRRQRDRRVKDNPALKIPAIRKLRACDHVLWGRFKQVALSIGKLHGASRGAIFVPLEIQYAGPKIHGPTELLGQDRVTCVEADAQIQRTTLKQVGTVAALRVVRAPVSGRFRRKQAGNQ